MVINGSPFNSTMYPLNFLSEFAASPILIRFDLLSAGLFGFSGVVPGGGEVNFAEDFTGIAPMVQVSFVP